MSKKSQYPFFNPDMAEQTTQTYITCPRNGENLHPWECYEKPCFDFHAGKQFKCKGEKCVFLDEGKCIHPAFPEQKCPCNFYYEAEWAIPIDLEEPEP